MPSDHRRWWDRQHRQDCCIAVPGTAIAFVAACLITGCPVSLWQPLAAFALMGALSGAALCYILPLPR